MEAGLNSYRWENTELVIVASLDPRVLGKLLAVASGPHLVALRAPPSGNLFKPALFAKS